MDFSTSYEGSVGFAYFLVTMGVSLVVVTGLMIFATRQLVASVVFGLVFGSVVGSIAGVNVSMIVEDVVVREGVHSELREQAEGRYGLVLSAEEVATLTKGANVADLQHGFDPGELRAVGSASVVVGGEAVEVHLGWVDDEWVLLEDVEELTLR